jgi:hypothetical protein
MGRRLLFGALTVMLAFPLMAMTLAAPTATVGLVAFVVYFLLMSVIGNEYIFSGRLNTIFPNSWLIAFAVLYAAVVVFGVWQLTSHPRDGAGRPSVVSE